MIDSFRLARGGSEELASSTRELLESTARNIFWGFTLLFFIALLATAAWPEYISMQFWSAFPLGIISCLAAIYLISRYFRLAMIIFLTGVAVTILLLSWMFKSPILLMLLASLPLIAVVSLGRIPGIGYAIFLVALLAFLDRVMLWQISPVIALVTITGAAISLIIGWAAIQSLLTITGWSVYNFQNAQEKMEESRQHRAELAKLAKNLDLTNHQLERANNMLVLARAEAEAAKDARNLFAMAISHELRTPLNFIIGFSEVMVKFPETYAGLDEWPNGLYDDAQEIYHSSTHLLHLINDVLDLGQIDQMQMTLYKEWVHPLEFIQEVKEMVWSAFSRKKINLEIDVAADLPQIFVDHTRLRQVLLNLVTNSLRFTEEGFVKIKVWQEEKAICFCVEDTGVGIAKEEIPKIFEVFHQVGNEHWRRREGSGLGIAISQNFIKLHGGKLWVESELGKGSRFYFTIPISQAAAGQAAAGQAAASPASHADDWYWQNLNSIAKKERRILVVSKDPSAGEIMSAFIDPVQIAAIDQLSAVREEMKKVLPAAVFVEQSLLEEGLAAGHLSGLPYSLPILSFPFPGSPTRPRGLPECVVDYLVKPVSSQTLLDTLRALDIQGDRLLIVDDDPSMIRFVELSIQSLQGQQDPLTGLELLTATSGSKAMETIHAARPGAILLDLNLPDISGWEVLKEAQAIGAQVVIVTAQDYPQSPADEMQETLRVIMHRPFKRQELNRTLNGFLETVPPDYPKSAGVGSTQGGPAG